MSSDSPGMSGTERRTIRRLLVANRGEIALRIMGTAHDMGIETVAVYADGDRDAPFVRAAHQAVSLAGRTSTETYLDVAKVLDAAKTTAADAIHPGYGFLAENAAFAQAVIDAGLIWVGPAPSAIAAMGDKLSAKARMVDAGVPTLPSIEVDDSVDVEAAALQIGYPVLVKATAGGGGKGMRVVEREDELVAAIAGAQREAQTSFGNGVVFLEKYLPSPRHIEIQVLGDEHGALVHLFERECSIQRRHQKIIEEAPSPVLREPLRSAMGDAAVAAARSIEYSSAGTVEFLLDGDAFFFLEVNTRIQVEHPVTEEITGVDLIREQLRISMGYPLDFSQDQLSIDGHAIEARLYAEDPANDFLPSIGQLHAFAVPSSPAARVDSGVEQGTVVGVEFDPMLAKIIVHAPTRDEAAARLALVLDTMAIGGVRTNRHFLVEALRHPAFLAGDTTTDFIARHDLALEFAPTSASLGVAAALATVFEVQRERGDQSALGFLRPGYRNSAMPPERRLFDHGDDVIEVRLSASATSSRVDVLCDDDVIAEDLSVTVLGCTSEGDGTVEGHVVAEVDGVRHSAAIRSTIDGAVFVQLGSNAVEFVTRSIFPDHGAVTVDGALVAPMPGKVLSVSVAVGDRVAAGQVLALIEAMKMEHAVVASADGLVAEVRCAVDDHVERGEVLVVLDSEESSDSSPD